MALACKICGGEVDAFSSIRCRQCQRLVCRSCVDTRNAGEGSAVCTECAASAPTGVEPPRSPRADETESPAPVRGGPSPWARIGRLAGRLRGEWAAVAFVVLLALVFLGIAFRPVLRAKVHRYRLTAEAEADRDAAQAALAAAGGGAVTREMIDLVLTGTDNDARYRAVRVLGAIGATEALPVLEGVRDDPKEAPLVRAAAREAIVGIEAY